MVKVDKAKNVFMFCTRSDCRMTKFDIRNYFQKIYGVDVVKVNTRIQLGKSFKLGCPWFSAIDRKGI